MIFEMLIVGIIVDKNLTLLDCLAIGDGENDVQVFRICRYSIDFNPVNYLEKHADKIVRGKNFGILD